MSNAVVNGLAANRRAQREGMRTARAVSAGGVVLAGPSPEAPVALIARRSGRGELQWTLPKGQQEPGETLEETALREVREETGLEVALLASLDTIDYWFFWLPERTRYHKFVHYFLMRATGGELSLHDREVEEAAWFPPHAARLAMAFKNERLLLDRIPAALGGQGAGPRREGKPLEQPPAGPGRGEGG